MLALRTGLSVLLCAAGLSSAHAEAVRVAGRAEQGHAWLFGAAENGAVSCWLAFPIHVLGLREEDRRRPFEFVDRDGRPGESGTPLPVGDYPAALSAIRGFDDLGFARVASGREPGDCLSRLGPDSFSFGVVLGTQPTLAVQNLFATSFSIFNVQVTRVGTASVSSELKLVAVESDGRHGDLMGGVSGAVALLRRGEQTVPFAMVTRLDPVDALSIRAVRFDAIAAAFTEIRASLADEEHGLGDKPRGGQDDLAFSVARYDAAPSSEGRGPGVLDEEHGCWAAAAAPGRSSVSIESRELDLGDANVVVVIGRQQDCNGGALPFGIDVSRDDGRTWTRIADCRLEAGETDAACRVPRRGKLRLRLVFPVQDLALSFVRLVRD